MARTRRHAFVDAVLEPARTPPGIERERQTEAMRQLCGLANSIASAYLARDDRIFALVLGGSLSRADIARATGLNKTRVDQIIRDMSERYTALRADGTENAGHGRETAYGAGGSARHMGA